MVAIVDYGVGNLFSLECSLKSIGADVVITGDRDVIEKADRVILPGVGAFGDAAEKLRMSGLDSVLIGLANKGKPIMGICLGMQLLLEKSYEYGEHKGLGLIKGEIKPIADVIPSNLKIPHIGWNLLNFKQRDCPIFKYLKDGDFVYFVHSFSANNCPSVAATTEYGAELVAAVADKNVYGCQFHPEKSGDVGLKILRAFCEIEV
ncbi:MAG: imidazole glycerol phosphate synthase subunit HisH [Ruminococcaceae bacterium]|nr:imidazole glycerol phosphate synthase subunit HisH [Oscillospiraceae bacterium]